MSDFTAPMPERLRVAITQLERVKRYMRNPELVGAADMEWEVLARDIDQILPFLHGASLNYGRNSSEPILDIDGDELSWWRSPYNFRAPTNEEILAAVRARNTAGRRLRDAAKSAEYHDSVKRQEQDRFDNACHILTKLINAAESAGIEGAP